MVKLMEVVVQARCYFRLNLKPGKEISYITLSELRNAAGTLADICTSGQQIAQGGSARSPGTYRPVSSVAKD
jgi:hypothetical protein